MVIGRTTAAISISHGRRLAVAVVGTVARLGIDLCEHDRGPRIRALGPRFLTVTECELLVTDRDAAAIWAAKEAGLKAFGLGLHDGLIDRCPIEIRSLVPPRYAASTQLALHVEHHSDAVLAVAYDQTPPSTSTVAPFM